MFFKDTTDYKTMVNVNANFQFAALELFLKQCDLTILKTFLGEEFIAELNAAFNAANGVIANVASPHKALIEKLRPSTAAFSLALWIPQGQLSIDQAGIRIANTETHKTAFEWQINNLETSLNNLGYTFLDDALLFLQKNIGDYPTYKASDEFKETNALFVSTAKEFTKYCSHFKNSYIAVYRLRSIIQKVQDFEIESVILSDLYNDLKTKLAAGDVLGSNAALLLEKIKPCVVNLTIAAAVDELACQLDQQGFLVFDNTGSSPTLNKKKQASGEPLERVKQAAQRDGKAYLDGLYKFLEKNKDNYPLYKNDSSYVNPIDVPEINNGEKKFFTGL